MELKLKKAVIPLLSIVLMALMILGLMTLNTGAQDNQQSEIKPIPNNQLWVRDHSPIIGPKEAPITLVEFIDPACEACRAMYPYVKEIMARYPQDIRLVIRYVDFHQQSVDAIRILEAARKQQQLQNVLEVLLAFQPAWAPHGHNGKDPWIFLQRTQLDIKKAKIDALDPTIENLIAIDMADVKAAGVKKTPSFFVNGKPLQLMHPDALLEMIEAELVHLKQH